MVFKKIIREATAARRPQLTRNKFQASRAVTFQYNENIEITESERVVSVDELGAHLV